MTVGHAAPSLEAVTSQPAPPNLSSIEELAGELRVLSPPGRLRLGTEWQLRFESQGYRAWAPWRLAWTATAGSGHAAFWEAELICWQVAGGEGWGPTTVAAWWRWPSAWIPVAHALLALTAGPLISPGVRWHLLTPLAAELGRPQWPPLLALERRPPPRAVVARVTAVNRDPAADRNDYVQSLGLEKELR